jgi:anhydro-N-acetylmuramic acid kinase
MADEYFIGLMSGTSLDGVDAVVAQFAPHPRLVETHFLPYGSTLRQQVLALQHPSENELENATLLGNTLAKLYAQTVRELLDKASLPIKKVRAIGCHGQTIRHQPNMHGNIGFSLQIGNAPLLAELTGITVISDFRARDVAAGGQGAPLVPAFHAEIFASDQKNRAILNIGGIANLTYLPNHQQKNRAIFGFDTGPGNMLLDAWINTHLNLEYDKNGAWASTGKIIPTLLDSLLQDHFFALPPPKSTGRDLFNQFWLAHRLKNTNFAPQDVARTLVEITAQTIVDALFQYSDDVDELYVCGGGAHNHLLMQAIEAQMQTKFSGNIPVKFTDAFGIGVDWVEAMAFAWLAKKCLAAETANLPAVTGAKGARILGNITQA